jgi:hypothetical protein
LIVMVACFLDLSVLLYSLLEVVPNPLTDACEITGAGAEKTLLGAARKLVVAAGPLSEEADGA